MNTKLTEKCDLLVENHKIIREAMKWESDLMVLAGSSFYVGVGVEANSEKLKSCHELLKDKAGIFSDYRGNVKIPLLCKMTLSEDPEEYFEEIHGIVDLMKDLKWISKEYKIMAAITIYDHIDPDAYGDAVEKMIEIYRGMREDHPWLTSGEDIPFAAMLAATDLDINALLGEMEDCYQLLKEYFFDKNAVQSLSHVLAADTGNTEAKCKRVKEIWDLLKEKGHKYGTGYELSVLGTLSLLDIPVDTAVEQVIEADAYLGKHKGFGNFSLGKKIRLMYAALMVANVYIPTASSNYESLLVSMHAIAMAVQMTMLLIVASTSAGSASN